MTTLSICIPTYSRSKCLAELLDSIVAQQIDDLEVIVSDDASHDDTLAVVRKYQSLIPKFKLIEQPVNIGLDRNFIEVTRVATGDYLWLMGDDDRLEPGSARLVLNALEAWPDVVGLTLGVMDYDPTMRQPTGMRTMPKTQLMQGAGTVFSNMAELLGFMSAMVVRRLSWENASADDSVKTMKNLYSQVYIVGRALGEKGTWGVVNELCVGFRSDNDQFKRKLGWFERLKVDVNAYDEIAEKLFSKDRKSKKAMRGRIFDTHIIARLINLKVDPLQESVFLPTLVYLAKRYWMISGFWIRGLPILLAPKVLIRFARHIYKSLFASSGAARARKRVAKSE